jgi:hypothetical protein
MKGGKKNKEKIKNSVRKRLRLFGKGKEEL